MTLCSSTHCYLSTVSSRVATDNERNALVGFLRAMIKGWEAAFEDPDTAIDLLMNKWGGAEVGMDAAMQRRVHDAQVPLMTGPYTDANGLFTMDTDLISTTMWEVLELTGIENLPTPAALIDLTILEDAFEGCVASLLEC